MFRLNLLLVSVCSLLMLAGCSEYVRMNDPVYQVAPEDINSLEQEALFTTDQMEIELVEKLSESRNSYIKDLASLKTYYASTGSFRKYRWAMNEETKFKAIPKYTYVVSAEIASKNLQAQETIESAEKLYQEGYYFYQQGYVIPVIPDKVMMRKAIAKFNLLISKYPTSEKIEDAAFRSAELYEQFGDWSLAATYYQRTFQWNADNQYPARYRAAKILDEKLKKRDIALSFYNLSIEKEGAKFPLYKMSAEKRVKQLNEISGSQAPAAQQ